MDDLDYIKVCTKDLNPRGADIIMARVNSPIPIVNIPKKVFRMGICNNSDRSISDNNPGWEYKCYSMDEIREMIRVSFPDIIPIYDSLKTDQEKINIGSYVCQYLFGGLYLGTNVEVTRSFDDLFYTDSEVYLTPSPSYPSSYTNLLMASKPKSQFWLDILAEIKKMNYSKPFWAVGDQIRTNVATGSGALTTGAQNTRIPFMVLPSSLISANSCCDLNKTDTHSYIRFTATNNSWDEQLLNYCWCKSNWVPYIIGGFFFLLFIIVIFRLTRRPPAQQTQFEWTMPQSSRMIYSPPIREGQYIYPNW